MTTEPDTTTSWDTIGPELLKALEWYVENDDTNEGDRPVDSLNGGTWDEYNAFWIEGKRNAERVITKAKELSETSIHKE